MDRFRPFSQRLVNLNNEIEQLTRDLETEKRIMAEDEKKREVMEKPYLEELSILEKQLTEASENLHVTAMATKMELREKRAREGPQVPIHVLKEKNRKLKKKICEEKENGVEVKLMMVWMEGRKERRIPRCTECREEYEEKVKVPKVLDCGHSICHPCCIILVQGDTLRCSVCSDSSRTPNWNVDRLPKNFALLNLIDSLT